MLGSALISCTSNKDGKGDGNQIAASPNEQLRELAGSVSNQPSKIEYALGGSQATGTLTFYWKQPATWRIDYNLSDTEGTLMTVGDESYACATVDTARQCQETPEGTSPFPLLSFFTDAETFSGLIEKEIAAIDFARSQRQLAGLQAICFAGSGEIGGQQGNAEYCFGNGLLLRLAGGGGGEPSLELVATSVSSNAPDSAFELPSAPATATP